MGANKYEGDVWKIMVTKHFLALYDEQYKNNCLANKTIGMNMSFIFRFWWEKKVPNHKSAI